MEVLQKYIWKKFNVYQLLQLAYVLKAILYCLKFLVECLLEVLINLLHIFSLMNLNNQKIHQSYFLKGNHQNQQKDLILFFFLNSILTNQFPSLNGFPLLSEKGLLFKLIITTKIQKK